MPVSTKSSGVLVAAPSPSAPTCHTDATMSFRMPGNSRPRSLLLRRTSSCSSLPLQPPQPKKGSTGSFGGGSKAPKSASDRPSMPPPPPLITLQTLREGVEHFSELVTPDPECHFCREKTSQPVHEDCTRLKIVSRGKMGRKLARRR